MKHAGRITHRPSLLHYSILEKDKKATLLVASRERKKFLSTHWPEFSDRIIVKDETTYPGINMSCVIIDEKIPTNKK